MDIPASAPSDCVPVSERRSHRPVTITDEEHRSNCDQVRDQIGAVRQGYEPRGTGELTRRALAQGRALLTALQVPPRGEPVSLIQAREHVAACARREEDDAARARRQANRNVSVSREVRHRSWVFTIQSPTDSCVPYLKASVVSWVRYIVVGAEIAPRTGTHHLQGYVLLHQACTFNVIKKKLSNNGQGDWPLAHIEAARGTAEQNQVYCSKESIILEEGDAPRPKKETNKAPLIKALEAFKKDADRRMNLSDLWDKHFPTMTRYTSGCLSYHSVCSERVSKPEPKVFVLWGSTNTGKSHWVRQSFGNSPNKVYWAQCYGSKLWCNGYTGQECFVLDDFEPRNLDRQFIKLLLDKYSCRVEPKGGMINMTSKYIVLTSNVDPKTWYRDFEIKDPLEDEHYLAVQRRLGVPMHFKTPYNPNNNSWSCGFLPHIVKHVKQEVINVDSDTDEDKPVHVNVDSSTDKDKSADKPPSDMRVPPRFTPSQSEIDAEDLARCTRHDPNHPPIFTGVEMVIGVERVTPPAAQRPDGQPHQVQFRPVWSGVDPLGQMDRSRRASATHAAIVNRRPFNSPPPVNNARKRIRVPTISDDPDDDDAPLAGAQPRHFPPRNPNGEKASKRPRCPYVSDEAECDDDEEDDEEDMDEDEYEDLANFIVDLPIA